jgi:hypothetical protein
VPDLPPEPTEDEGTRQLREHRELLEPARRYARAKTLAYDRELALRLLGATSFAATIPPVISLWSLGLSGTAGLVADVARNADDQQLQELIDRCAGEPPLPAIYVARELQQVATEQGFIPIANAASAVSQTILASIDWAAEESWRSKEIYAGELLAIDAATRSPEAVRARLDSALRSNPRILAHLIRGCAEWIEHRDTWDWNQLLGYSRRYSALPCWFPTAAVTQAIAAAFPHVVALEESRRSFADQTDEDLAAQILYFASPK